MSSLSDPDIDVPAAAEVRVLVAPGLPPLAQQAVLRDPAESDEDYVERCRLFSLLIANAQLLG